MPIPSLPDRVAVYHTGSTGTTPEQWEVTGSTSLRASVRNLTANQALTANAEGRWVPQVTHQMRCEFSPDVSYNALVRRLSDDKCFLCRVIRFSVARRAGGTKPDHLIVDLSVIERPPALPDALTASRRDR